MSRLNQICQIIFGYQDSQQDAENSFRRLKTEYQDLKHRIYEFASKNPILSGTTVDYGTWLNYDNDGLMSGALADLEFEGKLERRGRETVFRDDGGAIILGSYGVRMS